MGKLIILNGGSDNDPTAEKVRDAFGKCNANFTELYDSKPDWKWINNCFVSKGSGNVGSGLEIGDRVYFKIITNSGNTLTLLGQTYNGGDDQLRTSYTQNQSIDI